MTLDVTFTCTTILHPSKDVSKMRVPNGKGGLMLTYLLGPRHFGHKKESLLQRTQSRNCIENANNGGERLLG